MHEIGRGPKSILDCLRSHVFIRHMTRVKIGAFLRRASILNPDLLVDLGAVDIFSENHRIGVYGILEHALAIWNQFIFGGFCFLQRPYGLGTSQLSKISPPPL